eukprot:5366402-Pleurochrysis_carterae.AAC.1
MPPRTWACGGCGCACACCDCACACCIVDSESGSCCVARSAARFRPSSSRNASEEMSAPSTCDDMERAMQKRWRAEMSEKRGAVSEGGGANRMEVQEEEGVAADLAARLRVDPRRVKTGMVCARSVR